MLMHIYIWKLPNWAALISHCATPPGQLGYTSVRNLSTPCWPLYLVFAMERTRCCEFPTVRGALKIKIFQISAKSWHASNWFSIVAKQQQEWRPALPLFGAVILKTGPLWTKNLCVPQVIILGSKDPCLFTSTKQLILGIQTNNFSSTLVTTFYVQ